MRSAYTVTDKILESAKITEAKYLSDHGSDALDKLAEEIVNKSPRLILSNVKGIYISLPFRESVRELSIWLAQLELA